MIKVGITGGIGSGKSIISKLLIVMGYAVYNSDKRARQLMYTNKRVKEDIISVVGRDAYTEEGLINKQVLSGFLFSSETNRMKINSIVHPAVFEDFIKWSNDMNSDIVFVESAILFESGLDAYTNKSIMVYAPYETRTKRITERDLISENDAIARINSQLPDEEKLKLCDYTIYNGDKDHIIPQVRKMIEYMFSIDR